MELITIKQQLDSVKGENSEKEQLVKEKADLEERKKAISNELTTINKRIKEIDGLLKVVEEQRTKKIIEIEQKFTKRK